MNQLTVVLPFALPPPELAPDLLRELQAPALAALLSRTNRRQFFPFDNSPRILPHEAWLAHALGLAAAPSGADSRAALAGAVRQKLGLGQAVGTWFLIDPVHIQIARNHLVMRDPRQLNLAEADSRILFDLAKPYFDEIGTPLYYANASTWLVRADDWAGLQTATPDAASGHNLTDWMPEGPHARACRKLQNEVQMEWHEHPVNLAREARGQVPINSFWLWGGASATSNQAHLTLFATHAPPWLAALAEQSPANPASVTAGADAGLAVVCNLIEAGLANDWTSWLTQMQDLEQEWFAPLLAALKQGRVNQLTLVLSHRSAYAEFDSSKNAQRKFWRKNTLNSLLT